MDVSEGGELMSVGGNQAGRQAWLTSAQDEQKRKGKGEERMRHAVMDFLLLSQLLLFLLRPGLATQHQGIIPVHKNLATSSTSWKPLKHGLLRTARSAPQKITECVFATSEEGSYYYEAEGNSEEVCGVYLFAEAGQLVRVKLQHLDVPCEDGGLVAYFDGWELNGRFFPGVEDHEKHFGQRYVEFCGALENVPRSFVTSQNAGMLHYRIPARGGSFRFYVEFLKNPAPCNILAESQEQFYTLRNFGKASNCTFIALFPAKIKVLALDVGVPTPLGETGTLHQCIQKVSDRLEIGGSQDLDPSGSSFFQDFCGLDSSPGIGGVVVRCEVSVVRLVSSGSYDNSATFSVGQSSDVDLLQSSYAC